jgi:hypothetical protein
MQGSADCANNLECNNLQNVSPRYSGSNAAAQEFCLKNFDESVVLEGTIFSCGDEATPHSETEKKRGKSSQSSSCS